jgi:hypothetical protein
MIFTIDTNRAFEHSSSSRVRLDANDTHPKDVVTALVGKLVYRIDVVIDSGPGAKPEYKTTTSNP